MSADDTVEIPKELLRRVMAEVEELRAERDRLAADLDAQRTATAADGEGKPLSRLRALAASVKGSPDDAEMATLRQTAEALQAERDTLAARLEKTSADRDRLRADADALRAQATDAQRAADEARLHAKNTGTERDALQRDIEALRSDHANLTTERDALLRTHPAPPTRTSASDSGAVSAAATQTATGALPEEVLQRAFTAWCRRGSPLISRAYLFSAFLRDAAGGLPTDVRTVFRDRSAAAVTFSAQPAGVEYWLVVVGGFAAVLPQPTSPYEFRETAPVYAGTATPDRLSALVLAVADARAQAFADGTGAAFSLASAGSLS